MGDKLVRKEDVVKVITAYFEARLDTCVTATEATNETSRAVELMQLINGMKEVEQGSTDISKFCDKLWKNAYQRGHADGRAELGCEGCIHINLPTDNFPCTSCSRNYFDMYDNKKGVSK